MSQTHYGWLDEGCPKKRKASNVNPPHPPSGCTLSSRNIEDEAINFESTLESEQVIDPQFMNDKFMFDCIAKFYLKLYGEFYLPYKVIQEISEGIALICNVTHSRIKTVLTEELRKCNLEEEKINLLRYKLMRSDLLYSSHSKDIPGPSFTSDHLRKKYFEDNFNYKKPTEISLDKNSERTSKKYQYVPVEQTLTSLFEDSTVQRELDKSFQEQPTQINGIASNYTDGDQFKNENHPKKEIHLFLFQDGFNPVMNVLGSAKNKFKNLGVYFTIGNLQPKLRSKITSKHLIQLVRESVLKSVGAAKCFEQLKKDLQKLETNGIMYKGENIKIVVQYSLGDNLGQHYLGGFIESFSGTFFCRFCNIKRKDFKKNPSATNAFRTRSAYNKCVWKSKLTGKHCQGIKHDSTFNNSLKYFHATTHLPPCIAHDLFEGIVSWDLSGIIATFVKLKWFSYDLLNRRIRKFRCLGNDATNKPALVNTKGSKLGGHAVQNWTLLRLLPFIIGDKIKDKTNDAWQLYLQMKQLVEFFCAPKFAITDVPFIRDVLLPQYYERRSRVSLLPSRTLRPKHHFVSHYPDLLLKYGPLIHLWTMPFEQKHKSFKQICRMSRNFKNLEYTLATRHQLNLCYTGTGLLFPEETGEIGVQEINPYSHSGAVSSYLQNINLSAAWKECESIIQDQLHYQINDFLLLSLNGAQIRGGFIRVILTNGSSIDFILETFETQFNPEIGVYELPLDMSGIIEKVSIESLEHPVPHPLNTHKNVQCFSLKYKLLQSND
ncbi:N-acetyl-gamma-glutamyl-phosphate reductase [Frankliniella fusca]|uniref:N-acetyl-gamma-glutamyl-phosphate reductase n=1 Tax=Frankliniella fusca TaxID=407009 RepID=A0AAE1LH28_9NEOP|nr:N-acetyl-gamma-glutamyl-phosphate reductase [Frankliniella fusca]